MNRENIIGRLLKTTMALALVLAMAMTQALFASEFNQNATRVVHLDYVPGNATVLAVSSANGDILVTGSDTDRVVVLAEISVNGRTGEVCEELANKVRIEFTRDGTRLVIDPDLPKKIGYGISISYVLMMPSRLGVDLETANGELSVVNCRGEATMEATNGSITGVEISGNVIASSVNGSIFLSKLISDQVTAETVNGRIDCECINKAPSKIDISTVNGSIEVVLPKNASAALSADTVNGGLNILTGKGHITSKTRGSIEMSIGNGAGRYELSSVNGSIDVVVANSPD